MNRCKQWNCTESPLQHPACLQCSLQVTFCVISYGVRVLVGETGPHTYVPHPIVQFDLFLQNSTKSKYLTHIVGQVSRTGFPDWLIPFHNISQISKKLLNLNFNTRQRVANSSYVIDFQLLSAITFTGFCDKEKTRCFNLPELRRRR